ncbi:reverse transcriptase (RNA-dependent DNA polymerase) domain-containing protein [Phthorimaea operculella]|nr:reverse transcriptase (RNA-dependent DNA polymerase) domain-containing protein [Phthorimaea operculella]
MFMSQLNKISNLIKSQKGGTSQYKEKPFYRRVENRTEVSFNIPEEKILEKGLKHCPNIKITEKDINNLAADLEVATTGDKQAKQACALELRKMDKTPENNPTKDDRIIKNIKNKIKENNLIVTKADKGNTVIITTKEEYTNKVDDFLKSGQFQVLKKDPTEIYNREVKNTVNSCESILQHTKPHFLIQMNPTPPRLHGYYKLHKEDQPIRPVVSYTGAPAYKLAKLANHLYKKLTKFKPTHTVENSIDLIQKIDNIIVPSQAKLVSFDVKNLFPSVPVKDCLKIIDETLCNSSLEAQEVIDLEAILRICLEQNYFLWEGKTYKQIDGLAMGSPLSPLCADIYMDDFEKSVLKSKFKEHIQYWYRYVDDILCLWTGSNETLQELLVHMNSINHNIQLTMELGGETINFLDLTISIKEKAHQYKIYRKATYSDNIIHATSRHPDNHKHAAFHAFIHRLVKVPMNDEDFRQELDTIKQIARNNGYKDQLIHNILKRKQKREAEKLSYNATQSEPANQKKWVKIPYIGTPSEKFKRLLNSDGRKTAFYSTNSLKSIICNNKDKIPMDHQSGIYSLTCDTCDSIYVGQTGRKFKTRIKEHLSSWKKKTKTSTFAEHLNENNHRFDDSKNVKYLHIANKGRKMDTLEAMEINRHKSKFNILNDQTCLSSSPILNYFN